MLNLFLKLARETVKRRLPVDSGARHSEAQSRPPSSSRVLPPFGGEMGIEVRSFLGSVEPWLRSDWRIISRRPELYPPGAAFRDEEYFHREREVMRTYGARRVFHSYVIPAPEPKLDIQFSQLEPGYALSGTAQPLEQLVKEARFELELRNLFKRYLLSEGRPVTRWDELLLSPISVLDMWSSVVTMDVVPPSYLPEPFLHPTHEHEPHIGVQLRRMTWEPVRNSSERRVLAHAERASKTLKLPILIYGEPMGCHLPDGHRHTMDDGLDGLLARELGYLKSCVVMFAPDSGWSDLTAWLRVPTLLEMLLRPQRAELLRPFQPRMALLMDSEETSAQVDRLLACDSSLPDPDLALEPVTQPARLARLKAEFLGAVQSRQ